MSTRHKNWGAVSILWKQCLCTVLFQTIHLANISFYWFIFTMWYMVSVWCMWSKLFSKCWVKLGEQFTVPVCKSAQILWRRLKRIYNWAYLGPFFFLWKIFRSLESIEEGPYSATEVISKAHSQKEEVFPHQAELSTIYTNHSIREWWLLYLTDVDFKRDKSYLLGAAEIRAALKATKRLIQWQKQIL